MKTPLELAAEYAPPICSLTEILPLPEKQQFVNILPWANTPAATATNALRQVASEIIGKTERVELQKLENAISDLEKDYDRLCIPERYGEAIEEVWADKKLSAEEAGSRIEAIEKKKDQIPLFSRRITEQQEKLIWLMAPAAIKILKSVLIMAQTEIRDLKVSEEGRFWGVSASPESLNWLCWPLRRLESILLWDIAHFERKRRGDTSYDFRHTLYEAGVTTPQKKVD